MANSPSEAEWKTFRKLREVALERFCERTLRELQKLADAPEVSHHARYLKVYRRLDVRDGELARAFNDFRRSTMVAQLAQMRALRLIEDAELETFSPRTQEVVKLLVDTSKPRKTSED